MHDDLIIEYKVNMEKNVIIINTKNEETNGRTEIVFVDVLTHSFKCIMEYNILLDIIEKKIEDFLEYQSVLNELKEFKNNCWPILYDTIEELREFLLNNNYKFYDIYSSYGMFGWIIAKDWNVKKMK